MPDQKIGPADLAGDAHDRVGQLLFGEDLVGEIDLALFLGRLDEDLLLLAGDRVPELRGIADLDDRVDDLGRDLVAGEPVVFVEHVL